jgi:hypothetical protein
VDQKILVVTSQLGQSENQFLVFIRVFFNPFSNYPPKLRRGVDERDRKEGKRARGEKGDREGVRGRGRDERVREREMSRVG